MKRRARGLAAARLAVIAVIAATAGLPRAAPARAGAPPPAPVAAALPPRPLNVLVLTCDALRADHLGAYGYPRPTSPNIDALAAAGTLFADAISQSAWTGPGIVSLLTGQYPAVHGMDTRHKTPDRFLPTALKDLVARGYRPLAFQATGDLYGNLGLGNADLMRFTTPELLRQAAASDGPAGRAGPDGSGGPDRPPPPFFIWQHLRNSHLPYHPREELRQLFARPESPPLPPEHLALVTGSPMIPAGTVTWDPAEKPAIEDLYDGGVRQNDDDVGAAIATLKELGLWESTIVVLTADHGEELLEHGQLGHASTTQAGTLYDEVLRIPLIIRVPGAPAGRVVRGLAQPVDVMPTVLEALGLPPDPRLQGISLLPEIRGERERVPRPVAFSETTLCGWQCAGNRQKTARLWAARTEEWKLIVHRDETGRAIEEKLFNLDHDPGEARNVLGRQPQVATRLRRALAAHASDNLERAEAALASALTGHRRAVEALQPEARTARIGTLCDELAMLRYVYRVENPSILDGWLTRRRWQRQVRGMMDALGSTARRYWVCGDLEVQHR